MSERPLRIALFSPGWPPSAMSNGIVTYVGHLRAGLLALGHEVLVLAAETRGLEGSSGVLALDAPEFAGHGVRERMAGWVGRLQGPERMGARSLGRRGSRGLASLQAQGPIDVMEIEETFGLSLGVQGTAPVPRVVRLHGPWSVNGLFHDVPRDRAFRSRSLRERKAALAADAVTAPSAEILNRVRDAWQVPLPEARVIGNPAPEVAPGDRWRREAANPSEILFVGRFDRVKGGDVMLQGFAALARRRPDVTLRFVGPDGTGQDVAGYIAREISPEVAGRIDCTGRQPPEAIGRFRREAAVTAVTSRHETFSITAIEAMAHGSPLVASKIPAIEEFASEGVNARFFEPGNPESLARVLESVLDSPEAAARLGERAAIDVAASHSVHSIAVATAEVYEALRARNRVGSVQR